MKTLFFFFLFFFFGTAETSNHIEWLRVQFPNAEIILKPLTGGLSGISLYKAEIDGRNYVLRVHQLDTEQSQREHFALVEAAKRKIAPEIIAISDTALLMEFICDKTLTIEAAKKEEVFCKIAKAVFTAHQMPGHEYEGESLLSKAERCSKIVLKHGIGEKEDILFALELIKKYRQQLAQYEYKEVNVHGDLNPRNIFCTNGRILLIDWAETNHEDPFYDLTYFSLKHNFSENEEVKLLRAYLMREPTDAEMKRFQLHKKIHHAFWFLTNLYLAKAELNKCPEQQINKQTALDIWGAYQKTYADAVDLTAQYFYDLSRLNLMLAK